MACNNVTMTCQLSGWIKILTKLTKHEDVRIAVPAARALINLDCDSQEQVSYMRRVYPLYPLFTTLRQPKVDVIFIHGLLGGAFITWRQRDMISCGHTSPFQLLGNFFVTESHLLMCRVRNSFTVMGLLYFSFILLIKIYCLLFSLFI